MPEAGTARVCRGCGEHLVVASVVPLAGGRAVSGYQHAPRPGEGTERDHEPQPTEPADLPTAEALRHLAEAIRALPAVADPAARDRQAVELATRARALMTLVRREAAQAALAAGIQPASYAATLGVSKGVVDQLLHGRAGKRQRPG